MNSRYLISCLILSSLYIFSGCKKENPNPVLKSNFTASSTDVLTGDTITFTNHSQNAFFYQWNFGDGNSSTLENPTHVYSSSGGYKVLLRATGSFTSDTSYLYVTVKPRNAKIISEGKGIKEISLGDKWATVQTVLPPTDTSYYSSYIPKYILYSNQIYYPQMGIYAGFISKTDIVENGDSIYEISVVTPYQGLTTKGITIGSRLSDVVTLYGNPEGNFMNINYTGYFYPSLGVDFYTNNNIDTALVAEIDVYYPNNGSARFNANNIRNFH